MKCVVNRRMTGHVRVSSLGMRYQGRGKCYTLEHTETARPDPRDPRQHRHFVNHNGTVYYVTANNLVYETNIERGRTVIFNPTGWTTDNDMRTVPVTMRKMEKVEWLFI